ncbi:MAG: hypothetical protein QM581_00755 [Pseudomonas sp.]
MPRLYPTRDGSALPDPGWGNGLIGLTHARLLDRDTESFLILDASALRQAALPHAQQIAGNQDARMGNPARDFKYNLHRFSHVLRQFGITSRALGVTAHGLRHEALIDHYRQIAGQEPPVRSGDTVPGAFDPPAREAVARLAGHSRTRVADAYLARPARPVLPAHDQPQAS